MAAPCLSDEMVARLTDDALSVKERESIDAHVDTCASCRGLLVTLGSVEPALAGEVPWLRAGDAIGRYEILGWLGAGGMGQVYRAHDSVLRRDVALKLVHSSGNAAAQARLADEAQAMAKLTHPNVVSVFDAGEAGGRAFIAMELIEGVTLGQWVKEGRDASDLVRVFRGAARGVAAAHKAGILHRDFKPANVLIDADGWARVSDFGLASLVVTTIVGGPRQTSARGTPGYMAPEVERGEPASERSDVFGFGAALFECLALSGGHDRRLSAIAARAMAEAPGDRYRSVDELVVALGTRRSWRVPVSLAALAGAAALGVAGMLWRGNDQAGKVCAELGAKRAALKAAAAGDEQLEAAVAEYLGRFDPELAASCAEAPSALRSAQLDCFGEGLKMLGNAIGRAPGERVPGVYDVDAPGSCRAEAAIRMQPAELAWGVGAALDQHYSAAVRQWHESEMDAAAEALEALALECERVKYLALASSAWLLLGKIRERTSDEETTRAAARRALATAQENGNGVVIFDSALLLARLEVNRDRKSPAVTEWMEIAESSMNRLGRPPFLEEQYTQFAGYLSLLRGQTREGLETLSAATELALRVHGPNAAQLASALYNEATALSEVGQGRQALEKLARSLDILVFLRGEEGLGVTQVLGSIGTVQSNLDDPAAIATLERALRITERVFGPDGAAAAETHGFLGGALLRFGREADAMVELKRALELWIALGGDNDGRAASTRIAIAKVSSDLGDDRAALAELELALPVLDGDPPDPVFADGLVRFGESLCRLRRCKQAVAPLQRALALNRESSGTDSTEAAEAEFYLGVAIDGSGDRAAGRQHIEAALAIFERLNPTVYASALVTFASLALGGSERAATLDRAAALLNPGNPREAVILRDLKQARERK